jgi:hypothetical protein
MELNDAVQAIDEAGEQEKATASDVSAASGAVDELDNGAFVAVREEMRQGARGGRRKGLSMRH